MKLAEDIKSLTYVKDHPAEVIHILFMLKLVAQGEKDIKYGDFIEQEEFFAAMDHRFHQ
ncbi:MAG TPA: hypothetical protein VK469_15400 [Candidatus Kapabacteria bacterium]|nr:hypothetical protein [Candidatus Kapabacteria bacterium]